MKQTIFALNNTISEKVTEATLIANRRWSLKYLKNTIIDLIDNGIIESVSQSGQSVLSKGRYWNTHIKLKGVNNEKKNYP